MKEVKQAKKWIEDANVDINNLHAERGHQTNVEL